MFELVLWWSIAASAAAGDRQRERSTTDITSLEGPNERGYYLERCYYYALGRSCGCY